MASSTKKKSAAKSAKKAKAPSSKERLASYGQKVTSIILDVSLHSWWIEECENEHRSFSSQVSILLERERARILQFRAAQAKQNAEPQAPLSTMPDPSAPIVKRKR